MGQPGDLLVAVLIGDAHQNHESRANLLRLERGIQRAQFIDHVHGRFGYSLQYDFHGSLQYNVCSHQPVTYATDWRPAISALQFIVYRFIRRQDR